MPEYSPEAAGQVEAGDSPEVKQKRRGCQQGHPQPGQGANKELLLSLQMT